MALRSLVVSLEARTGNLERGISQAERKIANFERSVMKAQRVLAYAATAGGIAIVGKKLFDLGSAVEETRNKFETTFGAATKAMEAFGQSFGTMAGLSRRTFQDMAATVGAVTQGMGFAEEASARFSEQVLRLAGDLASFNNLQTSDVVQRMTAALTGERESMKRLGVVITEAEVQQLAFANTGKTVAASLTQQEKATATLTLMTQKAGKAVGDLTRTQDSAANKAKQIGAQFKTLAEDFATKMLPALQQMLPALQALIPPLTKLVELTGKFVSGLALTSPRIARRVETADRIAAERASFAALGPKTDLGLVRDRYNREIQGLTSQLGALDPRSWARGPNSIVENLVTEIRAYGQLIAEINRRVGAAADGLATDVAAARGHGASLYQPIETSFFRTIQPRLGGIREPRPIDDFLGRQTVGRSPFAYGGGYQHALTGSALDAERYIEQYGKKLNELADASTAQMGGLTEAMDGIWTQALSNMEAALGNFFASLITDGVKSFQDLARQIVDIWAQMIGRIAAAQIFAAIFGTPGGNGLFTNPFTAVALPPAAPAAGGETIVVQNNITAMDTQSAAQVMRQNRGVIIGTVQDALYRPRRGASFQRHLR